MGRNSEGGFAVKSKAKSVSEMFKDRKLIDQVLRNAVRDALRQHKQAGNPVVEWRDGKANWIAPEDIKIWDEE